MFQISLNSLSKAIKIYSISNISYFTSQKNTFSEDYFKSSASKKLPTLITLTNRKLNFTASTNLSK